jgi:hypothetical protein
MIMVNYADL